jgi:hypothetical protein
VIHNHKLPDGVQLVKSDTFWPEGRFYFIRGEMVWSRKDGWKKYYEVNREDAHFKTAEEAMAAWESSKH